MKKLTEKIVTFWKQRNIRPHYLLLWLLGMALVIAAGVGLSSLAASEAQIFPVYITEVMASNSSYPNEEGFCCDFIELYNSATYPVDLTGFQLGDVAGGSRYAFEPGTVIAPRSYLVVYCDKDRKEEGYAPFEISRAGGEYFCLIADNKAIVDSVTTIAMDIDQSAVLLEDGTWQVTDTVSAGQDHSLPRPAVRDHYNTGVSPVRLTEFSGADTGYIRQHHIRCDWVELHNTAAEPVDISGFILSDNVGNDKYRFPEGTVLEANGYLLVNCSDRVEDPLVAPFGLSREGSDTVVLKAADGRIVELVQSQTMDSGSMALNADGSWEQTSQATPGYANESFEQYMQLCGLQPGTVRIREVMSAGQMVLADGFGDFPDWVELHNTGTQPVELGGWSLSDDPQNPQKWMFPQTVLAPDQRMVIFCSGRDTVLENELHAGFGLSAGGEELILTAISGICMDRVSIPAAEAGTVLTFDENGQPQQQAYPTPGFAEDAAGYEAFCQTRIPTGSLAIWEVMTVNESYLPQRLGRCYDWVELRNLSDTSVDLSDYSISDDPDLPDMHVLGSRVLQPGESTVIILSGEEGMAREGYEHAMFSLDAREDQLLLYDGQGTLVDYVYLSDIPNGYSYGRSREDSGFSYMQPSPFQSNQEGFRLISDVPSGSHAPGVYSQEDAFTVALDAVGDIYYTLDGSIPDRTSNRYTQPLVIDQTAVLRAVSAEEGKLASEPYTATFVVGQQHDLPIVSLVTEPEGLWGYGGVYKNGDASVKEIQLPANVAYRGADGSFSLDCGMNMHGATTVVAFEKKSFSLQFKDGYDGLLHYDVFEDGEVTTFSSLLIRTSHEASVSSQMHDALIGQIASQCSDVVLSQKHKYVALYLNGEYWGLYALRERHSPEHFASYMDVPAEAVEVVRYPNTQENDLHQLHRFCEVNSLADDEDYAYACSILDPESFADWIIFQAYMANMDINSNMRYYYSPQLGRWYCGLADLDLGMVGSFGTFDVVADAFNHGIFAKSMMGNKQFQDLLARRLAQLLKGPLSDENVIATIEQMAATIRNEAGREQERWGTTVKSWESAVQYMIDFCDGRAEQMINGLCAQFGFTSQQRQQYFEELG